MQGDAVEVLMVVEEMIVTADVGSVMLMVGLDCGRSKAQAAGLCWLYTHPCSFT